MLCVVGYWCAHRRRASDKCQREKRKTINGDDLLWAMSTLGFEEYVEPLKLYLSKYREVCGCCLTSQAQHAAYGWDSGGARQRACSRLSRSAAGHKTGCHSPGMTSAGAAHYQHQTSPFQQLPT